VNPYSIKKESFKEQLLDVISKKLTRTPLALWPGIYNYRKY